jgi:hypothetical protein
MFLSSVLGTHASLLIVEVQRAIAKLVPGA